MCNMYISYIIHVNITYLRKYTYFEAQKKECTSVRPILKKKNRKKPANRCRYNIFLCTLSISIIIIYQLTSSFSSLLMSKALAQSHKISSLKFTAAFTFLIIWYSHITSMNTGFIPDFLSSYEHWINKSQIYHVLCN